MHGDRMTSAIFTEQENAAELLEQKIATLEAQRAHVKQANAAFRKEHRAELAELSAYGRDRALPYPSYVGKNLTGLIVSTRKRLAELPAAKERLETGRTIVAKYNGRCVECGYGLQRGETINYSRTIGARCVECAEGVELAVAA
jgi:BMFP domain-containing protein YqiC